MQFNPSKFLGCALISELAFCPRSFAYRIINYQPLEEKNFFIIDGRGDYERTKQFFKSRDRFGYEQLNFLKVTHPSLPITGCIDRVIKKDDAHILIEEKRGRKRDNEQHRFQLQLYAWLYSLSHPDIKLELQLYFSGSRRNEKVDWNEDIKNRVELLVSGILTKIQNINLVDFPPVHDQRCIGCMFEEICGEV